MIKKYGKKLFGGRPNQNKDKVVFLGALNPTVKKELSILEGSEVIDVFDDPSFFGGDF